MALEGRNVAGQAQVYGQTQNAVNQFAKTLQQQEAKRQAEAKSLQDELAKVKVDGVRQGDLPEFNEKYNQWKDSFAKLQGERDNAKKMVLRRDFDRTQQELLQIADDSKNLAKGEEEFGKMLLNPNIRDRYKEDAVTQFQKSRSLSRNDPNFVRDLTKLQHQIDLSKIMQELDKEDDEVMKVSKYGNPVQTPFTQGNRTGVLIEQSRTIDPQQQALRYSTKFDLDNGIFRTALRELFPQFAELPNEQFKQAIIPELVKQRAKTEFRPPVFKEDEDNSMTEYQKGILALREASASSDSSTYRQKVIDGVLNNNKASIDEMKAYLPANSKIEYGTSKKTPNSKGGYNFIRIDIPAVVDEANGTIKRMPITEDISLSKGDAMNRINAILNLYTGENISPSKLNIEGGKPRGEQIKIKGQAQANQPKPVSKKLEGTSAQLEQSAKAKGMTKSEYKKALQDAGYTVIEK